MRVEVVVVWQGCGFVRMQASRREDCAVRGAKLSGGKMLYIARKNDGRYHGDSNGPSIPGTGGGDGES